MHMPIHSPIQKSREAKGNRDRLMYSLVTGSANACAEWESGTCKLVALRDIKQGEEVIHIHTGCEELTQTQIHFLRMGVFIDIMCYAHVCVCVSAV